MTLSHLSQDASPGSIRIQKAGAEHIPGRQLYGLRKPIGCRAYLEAQGKQH